MDVLEKPFLNMKAVANGGLLYTLFGCFMEHTFASLGLSETLVDAVKVLGFEEPTPVQVQAIPPLLQGRDVLALAQTGTGKTAAFSLPMIQLIDIKQHAVQGLVLTPTRELTVQVAEAIHTYGESFGLKVLPVFGGQPIDRQIRRLQKGMHLVVGTPGRVIDLLDRKELKLDHLRMVVMDEADQMLDMGFIDAVEEILQHASKERQTSLFSATMPSAIRRLAQRYLKDPVSVTVTPTTASKAQIEQRFYTVSNHARLEALSRILAVENPTSSIIFTRTKRDAAQLAQELQGQGYRCDALHGDIDQMTRQFVLDKFRNQQLTILTATDVAARGLDINDLSHVFNYEPPQNVESYIHRIGRTGRAGKQGVAITLIAPQERRFMSSVERHTGKAVQVWKLPTLAEVEAQKLQALRLTLETILEKADLAGYEKFLERFRGERDALQLAAAALYFAKQGPFVEGMPEEQERPPERKFSSSNYDDRPRRTFSSSGSSGRPRSNSGSGRVRAERY
jgi:ATP-dependent RNA helicase DeaD